ncbi:hypothetical protein GJ26_07315 [Vibrio cholerae]|nr:hypothetical protein GJ26_07315 [Vibrio cholerae]
MTDLITRKPSDWDIKNLENIATFITKGATPTTYGFEWVEESSDSIPSCEVNVLQLTDLIVKE